MSKQLYIKQSSVLVQFQCQKQFYFKQFSVALARSFNVSTFLFPAIQFSQTVLIQTIEFSISMQLVLLKQLIGPNHMLPFRSEWIWEQWQWRGTPHSQKLQHP